MKKLTAIIIFVFFGFTCASAAENKIVKKEYNIVTEGAKTCDGVLKQLLPLDYSRTNPVVIVQGANDAVDKFVVRPSAAVFNGSDGKLLSLKDVPLGAHLQITYDAIDGVNKASGIKVLSDAMPKAVPATPSPVVQPLPVAAPNAVQSTEEDKDIK